MVRSPASLPRWAHETAADPTSICPADFIRLLKAGKHNVVAGTPPDAETLRARLNSETALGWTDAVSLSQAVPMVTDL
jgi:hypothetical protein